MILLTKEKNNEWIIWPFDYSNVKFGFVGPNKDVSFHEYMHSEERFNAIKK